LWSAKSKLKELLLVALIAGGHVLIEGPPGSAKTTLANSFARAIGGTFKRVQLTPDMMPSESSDSTLLYNREFVFCSRADICQYRAG